MKIERRSFLKGLASAPLLAACGETTTTNVPPPAAPTQIKIAAHSWGTSQLIAKIAELLLREQLGVPAATQIVAEGEIWDPLARGDVHACLEVWPLRNGDGVRAYVDAGRVVTAGTIGSGRTAWFVPSYVADEIPEIMTAVVASDLGPLLARARVAELVVGPGDWLTPTPPRMSALGVGALPIQRAGSEKALLDRVRQGTTDRATFMVSLWYPHPIHALYGLRAVGLPAAAGCSIDDAAFGCDYPAEPILKVIWPGLAFTNPDVKAFFDVFAPPLDDMVSLLASSADAPEVLARDWIKSRTIVWTSWINAARSAKK